MPGRGNGRKGLRGEERGERRGDGGGGGGRGGANPPVQFTLEEARTEMVNIVVLDPTKLSAVSNTFLSELLKRFNEFLSCVVRFGTSFYNAYIFEVFGELARRVCKEANVRLPAKKDDFYIVLVQFFRILKKNNIQIRVGGTTGTGFEYAQANTRTNKIHFNHSWCASAVLSMDDDPMATRSHTVHPYQIHLAMGLVKLPHELAHLFTIPLMAYICKDKKMSPTADNLITPSKIGRKRITVQKKHTTVAIGDTGFELEQILMNGFRLYFRESENFEPTTLLFDTPAGVSHVMEDVRLAAWIERVCTGQLPAEFTPSTTLLQFLRPSVGDLKANTAAGKKRKIKGLETKKATKARESSGTPYNSEWGSSEGIDDEEEQEQEETSEDEGYDIPKDYIVEGKPWIKT